MEQRLQEVLLEGEEVRWSGRPAPFRLLQRQYRGGFFATWLLSVCVVVLAAAVLAPMFAQAGGRQSDFLVLLIVVAFFPAMLSLRPVLDKLCLEKNTLYAITNLRVIALVRDDLMYIPISKALHVAIEDRDADCGNLCFDQAIGQKSWAGRANAVLGIRQSCQQCRMLGMLFYHIPQPDRLLHYLA